MKRSWTPDILACLAVPGATQGNLERLCAYSPSQWEQVLPWLDLSGLALYFWQRLNEVRAEGLVPSQVQSRLARNLRDNQARVFEMAKEFEAQNRLLNDTGVDYAVLKGFALIPQYCPDAALRTSYDYDYFVRTEDLPQVQRAFEAAGFRRKVIKEDHPLVYFDPNHSMPSHAQGDDLYSSRFGRLVELHVKLWDEDSEGIHLPVPEGALDRIGRRTWNGISFPALADDDNLIAQVLHIFHHMLNNWCRLSLFLELACFLERQSVEKGFWEKVRHRTEDSPQLPETMGVVFSLASSLFGTEVPAAAASWTSESLSPATVRWIERYGRASALANFSGNKFSLFLHRQYIADPVVWRNVRRRRLFPLHRPTYPNRPALPGTLPRWSSALKQGLYASGRLVYHLANAVRYGWESVRWERAREERR